MMKRVALLGALVLAAGALAIPAATAGAATQPATATAAAPTVAGVPVPINFTGALGSFAGTFNVTHFAVQNGQLVAMGTLTGTVKDALGNVLGTVNQALTLPVAQATGSCQILDQIGRAHV